IENTCAAVQTAGARRAKVISLISPAESPSLRHTVYCLVDGDADHRTIQEDILAAVEQVNVEMPGFRLKQAVQFENVGVDKPLHIPEIGRFTGAKVTVLVEIALESSGFPT